MPITTNCVRDKSRWLPDVDRIETGTFEVWICGQCGFTEWYAKDPNEALEKLLSVPGSGVSWYDGDGKGSPYR